MHSCRLWAFWAALSCIIGTSRVQFNSWQGRQRHGCLCQAAEHRRRVVLGSCLRVLQRGAAARATLARAVAALTRRLLHGTLAAWRGAAEAAGGRRLHVLAAVVARGRSRVGGDVKTCLWHTVRGEF
jgi:hypothetical protein